MRRRRCTCPAPWSPSSRSPSCRWLSAWWRSWPGTAWENGRPRRSLLVRLGRRSLRLPGLRLSLLQLLITALDVAAAATVLYLLLPETPPFAAFLLVYLLALAAGVLSHVPGGVGVFEAVLLAAFAGQLGAAPLAAALLLYRLIYVVLPLLLACLFCCSSKRAGCG